MSLHETILEALATMESYCLDSKNERECVAAAVLQVVQAYNPPSKIVRVVGLIEEEGGRYLVRVRTSSPEQMSDLDGAYECPGGKMQVGETLLQALAREIKEEAGITIRTEDVRLLDVYDDPRTDVPQTAVTFFFQIPTWEGAVRREPGKAPWEWRTEEEIKHLNPHVPNTLLNYFHANEDLIELLMSVPLASGTQYIQQHDFNSYFRWFVYGVHDLVYERRPWIRGEAGDLDFWQNFEDDDRGRPPQPVLFETRDEALRSAGLTDAKVRRYVSSRDLFQFMETLRPIKED